MRFIESCGLVLKRSGAEHFKHPRGYLDAFDTAGESNISISRFCTHNAFLKNKKIRKQLLLLRIIYIFCKLDIFILICISVICLFKLI